jgi:hypothetical protein
MGRLFFNGYNMGVRSKPSKPYMFGEKNTIRKQQKLSKIKNCRTMFQNDSIPENLV